MPSIFIVLLFSLIGGVLSLIGGLLLVSNKKRAFTLASYATPFAAGALLAAAFIDLLPEATHSGDAETALFYTLIGIVGFFLLERLIRWHHHHDDSDDHTDPAVPMVIIGDTLHNFIDGIAIAAGFLVDTSTGIVVTMAVAAHEIPQEIGDFGLLLSKGLSRKKVVLANIGSALATTVAAVFFFQTGQSIDLQLDAVLGLVAGFFIYIAVSDIIPDIHLSEQKLARSQTLLLLVGVLVVSIATTTLHDYIDVDHGHESSQEAKGHDDEDHEDHDHADDEDHHNDEHKENHSDKDHE